MYLFREIDISCDKRRPAPGSCRCTGSDLPAPFRPIIKSGEIMNNSSWSLCGPNKIVTTFKTALHVVEYPMGTGGSFPVGIAAGT
jgi:hypothetical protein